MKSGLVVEEDTDCRLDVLAEGGQSVLRPGSPRAVLLEVVEKTAASVEGKLHIGREKGQLAEPIDPQMKLDKMSDVAGSLAGSVVAQVERHFRVVVGIAG